MERGAGGYLDGDGADRFLVFFPDGTPSSSLRGSCSKRVWNCEHVEIHWGRIFHTRRAAEHLSAA